MQVRSLRSVGFDLTNWSHLQMLHLYPTQIAVERFVVEPFPPKQVSMVIRAWLQRRITAVLLPGIGIRGEGCSVDD
jgi:hypothetical protein